MTQSRFPYSWVSPDWSAPDNIVAVTSSRQAPNQEPSQPNHQGLLKPSIAHGYEAFNLALHVGDHEQRVLANRHELSTLCGLPEAEMKWLEQIHSNTVIEAGSWQSPPKADAIYSRSKNQACIVMTADCLPVLFCNRQGTQVAAAHAGWRGLAGGVLSNTVQTFDSAENVLAWLGPAIGPSAFEVGVDVYQAFCSREPASEGAFFASDLPGKWYADLYLLARQALQSLGVQNIFGGGACTYTEKERYYSYRRDGAQSGRMASLIYLK